MIFASGLKYVGVGTTALGWTLGIVVLAAVVVWLAYVRPGRAGTGALASKARSADVQLEGAPPT